MSAGAALGERLRTVGERLRQAADRAGRAAEEIVLIGAAKGMPVPAVRAAVAAGLRDVGENYVQEAAAMRESGDLAVRWHMIGRLQRNKAARAVELFDVVHTVDRAEIGEALARHAARRGVVLPILVEVNLAGEATKSGVEPERLADLLAELRAEPALRVDGLMAIPPPSDDREARRWFRILRELRDRHGLRELSMGMSDDFEIAVEEGATMVRVGRAIFGERR